jgi:hypothetical protein
MQKDKTTYHEIDGVDNLRLDEVEVDSSRDIVVAKKTLDFCG